MRDDADKGPLRKGAARGREVDRGKVLDRMCIVLAHNAVLLANRLDVAPFLTFRS